ncbi:flagellar protein FlaG [Bacillus timonensis]|nr:flagellar protein FlaG [Bacillus timonensis]
MSVDRISSSTSMNFSLETSRTKTVSEDQKVEIKAETNKQEERKSEQQEVTREKLRDIVDSMNKFVLPSQTSVQFEMHDELEEYYVKIVDKKTAEVIREIPSKKMLDIYAAMTEYLGLVVDKKI